MSFLPHNILPPPNPYSPIEAKQTLDSALKLLLTKNGYTENHRHTDVKLVCGYISIIAAAAATGYSYVIPFEECWWVLAIGVSM